MANCFIYTHFSIFILASECFCLLYKCVYLSNTSRKSHLFLEPNQSKVRGKIPTCLPLVNILNPLLPFLGLKGPEGSKYSLSEVPFLWRAPLLQFGYGKAVNLPFSYQYTNSEEDLRFASRNFVVTPLQYSAVFISVCQVPPVRQTAEPLSLKEELVLKLKYLSKNSFIEN